MNGIGMSSTGTAPSDGLWRPVFAPICRLSEETPGVRTFTIQMPPPWSYRPGQFHMLYLPGYGEAAISISGGNPDEGQIDHTVRLAGNVTGALFRLAEGDHVGVRGPFGSVWPIEACRGRDVVIAAGGIGLAPLRPVLAEVVRNRSDFGHVWLVYGARTPSGLLYSDQYDAWRDAEVEVRLTVDHADETWHGAIGVVPALLDRLDLQPKQTVVLTCGPEIMMRFVSRAALERGIDSADVHVSMERNMNCAVGLCGHCQLGPHFICKDGPVFPYTRIGPYLYLEDV